MSSSRKYLYPDISDILERKASARRENARRPYGEKLDIVEAMRDRIAPFKKAREERRQSKSAVKLDG
jgi:hypothetical protein